MNFGDILDQWETEQKISAQKEQERKKKVSQRPAGSGKKLNAPTKEEKEAAAQDARRCGQTLTHTGGTVQHSSQPKINPMDYWIHRYGIVDKDKDEELQRQQEELQDPLILHNLAPEAQIDLHGLTRDEAWTRLDQFITECQRRGLQKVLIIHGKGNHSDDAPVLSGIVRSFIERDYRLGQSGHPGKQDGGRGATWVVIRPAER